MSTAATTTEWELRLKDYVSAPFKKLIDYATGSQKKLAEVANGLTKAAQASNAMGRDFKRNYGGLESTLSGLEKRQKEAFTTKHILAYQKMIDRTKAEMEKLNAVTKPTLSGWSKFKNNLKDSAQQIPGVNMLGNPALLMGAGVFALGVGLKKSATLALDYETGMAKINATAQLSTDSLGLLKNRLIDIGSSSGGNFELIPDAYEKILSQTGKVNLSLDIMETAVKGAKAGFTDIDTLASAVGQSLSSIGEQNAKASEVLDTFMMAKKVGAGEFKDFAQYLPQLIASGKNLAVSYKDTAGMFAYMTGKGQSASDSAMLMNNAFTALQKNDVVKGLENKGIKMFDANGMRRDVKDVFLDLGQRLSGMSDLKKLDFFTDIKFNDAQAKIAFGLLTQDAEKFKATMGDVNDALGETDRQLAMTANSARTWGNIGDKLKSWGVAIGDVLLPIV
ncbi:MAG: phage tail tape measure protein, partial [Bacteroidetes bacterium]|nr:phage tail tape measure protein [Bacteroidota bacterium]